MPERSVPAADKADSSSTTSRLLKIKRRLQVLEYLFAVIVLLTALFSGGGGEAVVLVFFIRRLKECFFYFSPLLG